MIAKTGANNVVVKCQDPTSAKAAPFVSIRSFAVVA
jgi:hypothetical protein